MSKDKKERTGIVYSTNPEFKYDEGDKVELVTLPPEKQNLKVTIDTKQRKGKTVTLVNGFVGTPDDLTELARLLKTKCGVGGSAKDNEILIQGNFKDKIIQYLKEMKYRVK